jgi:Reverse transcriptase (RNA-dependent DNA polymerase)
LTDWSEALRKISDLQGGFRPGRGTIEQIFTLHEITAMRSERGQSTMLAFLDCRRAYDRCWRAGLADRMWSLGIKGRMWSMIQDMLASVSRQVVIDGEKSEPFNIDIGVPQGAVLSPLLYSIFIQGLSDMLISEGFGLAVCGTKVPVLLYADDIVLLAEDADELQAMLDAVSRYAVQWQFRFNPKKCNVVVVTTSRADKKAFDDTVWSFADGSIAVTREYKYLGAEIGKIGRGQWNSCLHRIQKRASDKMNQLLHAAGGKHPLQFETSIHLYKTLVRPVMEYADAVWAAMSSNTALNELESLQCKFGRSLLRCPGAAGEFVRAELGMCTMRSRVHTSAMRFYGKLCNMDPRRLTFKLFRARCNEVDAGGGRNSWCAGIKSMLTVYGLQRHWRSGNAPEDWKSKIKAAVQTYERDRSEEEMKRLSSLNNYRQVKQESGVEEWMESRHPGVRVRLQLRSDTAPLMSRVGARAGIRKDMRLCLHCGTDQVEDIRHFACLCSRFDDIRTQCLDKLAGTVKGHASAFLADALRVRDDDNVLKLMLGSAMFAGLPPAVRKEADNVVLNGLKLMWRRRNKLWRVLTKPNDPWQLNV